MKFAYGAKDLVPLMMLTVGTGEVLAVGVLGNTLLLALERSRVMSNVSAACKKKRNGG